MSEYAGAHLLSQFDGLDGRRLRWPEFCIIPKLNRIRRQVRKIAARKLGPRFKLNAQTLKFLQVVCSGNLQPSSGENTFQILLNRLLGVEACGVVRTFTSCSSPGIRKVAVALPKPPPSQDRPIFHRAVYLLTMQWR